MRHSPQPDDHAISDGLTTTPAHHVRSWRWLFVGWLLITTVVGFRLEIFGVGWASPLIAEANERLTFSKPPRHNRTHNRLGTCATSSRWICQIWHAFRVSATGDIIWPKNWGSETTCDTFPASYFHGHTSARTNDAGMRHMVGECVGGIFWVRTGSDHKESDVDLFSDVALEKLKAPFLLISGDGDTPEPSGPVNSWFHKEKVAKLLQLENFCGWYTQDYDGALQRTSWFSNFTSYNHPPKIFPIPIGFDLHTSGVPGMEWYRELRNSPQPKRKLAILIDHMSNTHPSRRDAMSITAACTEHLWLQERLPVKDIQREYYRKFAFGLSPRGNGIDCHRTWEMLYLGMIPILLHSSVDQLYDGLPVVLLNNWTDVCQLDLAVTLAKFAPLLPVPDRFFSMRHWIDRYRPNHTCAVTAVG